MFYDCPSCEYTLQQYGEPSECPICGASMYSSLFDDGPESDDPEEALVSPRDAWLIEGMGLTEPIGLHP